MAREIASQEYSVARKVRRTADTNIVWLRCHPKNDAIVCYGGAKIGDIPDVGYANKQLDIRKAMKCHTVPGKRIECD